MTAAMAPLTTMTTGSVSARMRLRSPSRGVMRASVGTAAPAVPASVRTLSADRDPLARQPRGGVDGVVAAGGVDLEVQVRAEGVAGVADEPHLLAGTDGVARAHVTPA